MKVMQLRILAAAGAWALTQLPAGAVMQSALESQVLDYGCAGAPVVNGVATLSYDLFDPTLGQLGEVVLTLKSSDSVQPLVFSVNGAGVAYSGASVSGGTETVTADIVPGLSTTTTTLASGPFSGTTTGPLTFAGTPTTQTLSSSVMIMSGLSPFVGTGSQNFDVSVSPGSGMYSGSGLGSILGFGGVFGSCGSVEIDYYYIARMVAVPETSHFSLYAGAFAGLVAVGGVASRARRPGA
jgi:hypothetical protein